MVKCKKTKIEFKYFIDKPRGRYGYLSLRNKKRYSGQSFGDLIEIDLGALWADAKFLARRDRKNTMKYFVDELVDNIVHELEHSFEPLYTRWKKGENQAIEFAKIAVSIRRSFK